VFVLHFLFAVMAFVRWTGGNGGFLLAFVPPFLLLWTAIFLAVSLHAGLRGGRGYARFLESIPALGRALRAASLARFARAFQTLHGAGVSYDETLRVAAEASGHAAIAADSEEARTALLRGEPFPSALERMRSIPSDDRGLLVAGEQSGDLEAAAGRVAQMEEDRFEVAAKRAFSLLPGVLMILVGAAVAWFVFSFYLSRYADILNMK
jgi:type II secretory pathway component PulF